MSDAALSLSVFKKTGNCNHFTEVSCMSMRLINHSFRDILDVMNNCASACDNNNKIILRKCHSLTRVKLISCTVQKNHNKKLIYIHFNKQNFKYSISLVKHFFFFFF